MDWVRPIHPCCPGASMGRWAAGLAAVVYSPHTSPSHLPLNKFRRQDRRPPDSTCLGGGRVPRSKCPKRSRAAPAQPWMEVPVLRVMNDVQLPDSLLISNRPTTLVKSLNTIPALIQTGAVKLGIPCPSSSVGLLLLCGIPPGNFLDARGWQ